MDHLFPYPKMGHSWLEILEDPLTRKLLGHDAALAERTPFISGVTSRLQFLLHDVTRHLPFLKIAYSALEAFLQANATGPPLEFDSEHVVFPDAYRDENFPALKREILDDLAVDGTAVYALAPNIELFWLANAIVSNLNLAETGFNGRRARFRVNFWHQKLLSEKSDTLHDQLYADADVLDLQLGSRLHNRSAASEEHYVEFLVERANVRIYYGDDVKAREDLAKAASIRHFHFALTGALGKRTKYQDRDISQLVVLAKSRDHEPEPYSSRKSSRADNSSRKSSMTDSLPASPIFRSKSPKSSHKSVISASSSIVQIADPEHHLSPLSGTMQEKHKQIPETPHTKVAQPENLLLNDDTLLERIKFNPAPSPTRDLAQVADEDGLSSILRGLDPSEQPILFPMDSIILLATASSISNTQAGDGLTREETLPYATRVLDGGSSNWQVYTQALLVRSRIEGYRSRTAERGLLQLQALVDQVIAETTNSSPTTHKDEEADGQSATPTTFLPKPKPSESASVGERLQYIHQLSPPLRWELEAELAQKWTSMGGLRTALEIYERLQLKAEVALCLAATDKEAEAVKMLNDLLFENPEVLAGTSDSDILKMRKPLPVDAPRLLCILGDILADTKYYILAWKVSGQRYARAQRALGRHFVRDKQPQKAAEAYTQALQITRLDNATWFALGCVQLELEDWYGAVESFTRVVQLEDRDAEGWSNLAVALLRLPPPIIPSSPIAPADKPTNGSEVGKDTIREMPKEEADEDDYEPPAPEVDQYKHTYEALRALRRAANLKRDDARIWDNYLTVAASIPPSQGTPWNEIIQAMGRVIDLRHKKEGEGAVDLKILGVLVKYITSEYEYPSNDTDDSAILLQPGENNEQESENNVGGELQQKSESSPRIERQATPEPHEKLNDDDSSNDNNNNNNNQDRSSPRTQSLTTTDTDTVITTIHPTNPNQPKRLPFHVRSLLSLLNTKIIPLASTPPLFTLLSQISLWRHRPAESLSYTEKSWRATTSAPSIYESEAGWNEIVSRTVDLVDAYRDLGPRFKEGSDGTAVVEGSWRFKSRSAIRGGMGRGRDLWVDSEGWNVLERKMLEIT